MVRLPPPARPPQHWLTLRLRADALKRKCLSLITKARTLDLEAESELVRDRWVQAFQHLLRAGAAEST